MTISVESVALIISLNGGKLVGKTRLQKSAYLLESCGVGFGFDFSYHYYGPYSEDLAVSADFSEALENITAERSYTEAGAPFVTYRATGEVPRDETNNRRSQILALLSKYGTIELELAATADFLSKNGYKDDPWKETMLRKAVKATADRVQKAKDLLASLREHRQFQTN
jgi:uncharacterized protein